MSIEIWKDIKGFDGKYQASNWGRIRSTNFHREKTIKILKQRITKAGYNRLCLYKKEGRGYYFVHILVYETFNGPIPKGMQVNHINEDKTDNRLCNLSLTTPKENSNWGTRTKRIAEKMKNRPDTSKPVIQMTLEGEIINIYPSSGEAERQTGVSRSNIKHCCNSKELTDGRGYKYIVKSAGGFKWRYAS